MKDLLIRVGPLNSINSLYTYLGPSINELRNRFMHGDFSEIKFDLRNLVHQKISISALTAFLTISSKIREATGKPIELLFNWDPNILSFLTDIEFFKISEKLDIFYWDERLIGGFQLNKTNPSTKLIYFSDKRSMTISNFLSETELINYKSILKQKIAPNFVLRCSDVMTGLNQPMINTITNSAVELIVNSLIHGQDIAIVGLQRSSKRITISVSDGGIGFKKSIIKTFGNKYKNINHSQSLMIGSLIQKKEHGLRLAIEEVLNFNNIYNTQDLLANEGWVNMSTYDSEIRWQKLNWAKAKEKFDKLNENEELKPTEEYLGDSKQRIEFIDTTYGYWKQHPYSLIGTRITFEISL